jgi:hypothetical protein
VLSIVLNIAVTVIVIVTVIASRSVLEAAQIAVLVGMAPIVMAVELRVLSAVA